VLRRSRSLFPRSFRCLEPKLYLPYFQPDTRILGDARRRLSKKHLLLTISRQGEICEESVRPAGFPEMISFTGAPPGVGQESL